MPGDVDPCSIDTRCASHPSFSNESTDPPSQLMHESIHRHRRPPVMTTVILVTLGCVLAIDWKPSSAQEAVDSTHDSASVPANTLNELAEVRRLIQSGELSQANDRLSKVDQALGPAQSISEADRRQIGPAMILTHVMLGQALTQDSQNAAETFRRCLNWLHHAGADLPASRRNGIRMASASALAADGDFSGATQCLEEALAHADELDETHRQWIHTFLMRSAKRQMQSDPAAAATTFALVAKTASADVAATADLGSAWCVLSNPDASPAEIGNAMADFVRNHPDHSDAVVAAHQAIQHFILADDWRSADSMLPFAMTSVVDAGAPTTDPTSGLTSMLVSKAKSGDWNPTELADSHWLKHFRRQAEPVSDSQVLALLVLVDAGGDQPDAFDDDAQRLIRNTDDADTIRWVQKRLSNIGDGTFATILSSKILTGLTNNDISIPVKLAACRRLAAASDWSSIAAALGDATADDVIGKTSSPADVAAPKDHDLPEEPALKEPAELLSILAESLVQDGRGQQSHAWWIRAVDDFGDTRITSLLRLAEIACQHGQRDEAAARVLAARQAAGTDTAKRVFVDLLDADLSIRALQFGHARDLLESVVRNPHAITTLRGRAQWLIGETYFLQQDYTAAIDAYRLVEGIDPESPWVAASLVQAGKSFEHLGRTQSASMCYGNLVRRFGDSPHSELARRRLANLPAASSQADSTLKR
ncbi:hypothetical protein Mal65_27550 [Crateriforma conspicua]|nr:hypothetical protein Mal65_27550 [Crateriforma conspicua]